MALVTKYIIPSQIVYYTHTFILNAVFHIFTVVIDCGNRLPKADTGNFECVYPRSTTHQEANFVALTTLEIPEKKYPCEVHLDTQPDTEPDVELGTELNTRSVTHLDTQKKSMFNKPEYDFDSSDSKARLKYKVLEETIYEHNCLADKTDTYEYKNKPKDSIITSISKPVEDLFNEIHPDRSAKDNSDHSKSYISITSSNLLEKVRVAGAQFARLLLSYFLIHLQSTLGISTLPNVVLESQKLRDSLCLRMSSPSKFFGTSGRESEKQSVQVDLSEHQ